MRWNVSFYNYSCFIREWRQVLRISVSGSHAYKAAKKKGTEKGTLKLVNFPLTQADDYVVIFISCVNV